MIKLNEVNKYFFKNRANQNQVCKDIDLEFDKTGLVVILGSSGSGKTTLLNIISGMDKFDYGSLTFDDEVFTKYKSKKWDNIRSKKIGYIFQNYNLLKDLSVYENIKLVLKMVGITGKEEIDKRVSYLLESVGMKNYENRLTKQLSGGQQQRIGFARALSKNPDIILADEPTGNLDSKTTIELMDILKSISKEKLVIMVTHEQALSEYYADRIIELDNGRVVRDIKNVKSKKLSVIQEQIIYLKDYEKTEMSSEDIEITKYSEAESQKEQVKIDVIDKQDTLYIKVTDNGTKRIKYIDRDSEIELLNESQKENIKTVKPFDFKNVLSTSTQEKKSIISIKDSFKLALKKVNVLSYGGKMLYLVLALVGIIISVSSGLLAETYRDDEVYTDVNKNYVKVKSDRITYDEIMALEDIDEIEQVVLIYDEFNFDLMSDSYYEIQNSVDFSAYPIDIKFLDESKLIMGEISGDYGIVIDKIVADNIIKDNSHRGINSYEDILNSSLKLQTNHFDTDISYDNSLGFKITGIAADNSKSIWMAEELIYSFVTPSLIDYRILGDGFVILDDGERASELPSNSGEVMVNKYSSHLEYGARPYRIGMSTGAYTISGIYDYVLDGYSHEFDNTFLTEFEYLRSKYFSSAYRPLVNYTFFVYTDDIDGTVALLNEMGFDASSSYLYEVERSREFSVEENANILILSITGIAISAISMYFIMRSSLISRVYEVSIYRSLGISKREVRRMFIVEILLTTTISSIIGFIAMSLLLVQVQSSSQIDINIVYFTFTSVTISVIGLYLLNIAFGLIPINILLSKTPSDIMKKYDL